jgi:DNA repair and recombination protein RAD54B
VIYIQLELIADGLLSPYLQKKKAALALLSEWKHINCQRSGCHDLIHDHVLRRLVQEGEVGGGSISFLFEKGSECERRDE